MTLALGPLQNNTYLVGDPSTQTAVVIDPSFDSQVVLDELKTRGWALRAIWLTHAHFDHLAGGQHIVEGTHPSLPVGLHPADMELWRERGGAAYFGIQVDIGPEPALRFYQGQRLTLGQVPFEVRHAPRPVPAAMLFFIARRRGWPLWGMSSFRGVSGALICPIQAKRRCCTASARRCSACPMKPDCCLGTVLKRLWVKKNGLTHFYSYIRTPASAAACLTKVAACW